MRPEEADLIAEWIEELPLPAGSVCLNIGSSTGRFRAVDQPHIGKMFERLEKLGWKVVHCDLKAAPGVDKVGDVLDPAFRSRMEVYRADVMLCSNLLEHLTDPASFARACGALVRPGGYGLFTVPYSYPYHPDPIDTMFRPTPERLVTLLDGWNIARGAIVEMGRYRPPVATFAQPHRTCGPAILSAGGLEAPCAPSVVAVPILSPDHAPGPKAQLNPR